jgi:phage shock protein E
MDFLKHYWPLILLTLIFSLKWWNSRKIISILPDLRKKKAMFIDVRSITEFQAASAPETINIPLQELKNRLSEIPRTIPIVFCCASGTRSSLAKKMLKKNGYKEVYNKILELGLIFYGKGFL